MINRLFMAVFVPKNPRGYTGRHRAPEVHIGRLAVQVVPAVPTSRAA